jgi:hypothetical protein
MYIQNVDSFSHLIDRLIVENLKLADFVRRLEIETAKEVPDHPGVTRLYASLRLANESRAACKNGLDNLLMKVVKEGSYEVLNEMRTFRLPTESDSEVPLRFNDHDSDLHDKAEDFLTKGEN